MATLFDDLIAEGITLQSIITHIVAFMADRRSERTFLVETQSFFEYIDETLLAVRKFVEQSIDISASPSQAKMLADLRDLKALEVVVLLIYRLVRQACDADTLAIPYPIIAYINSLMQDLPTATNAKNATILAIATDELNFLHHRLDTLRQACERCSHLKSLPENLGIIAFPYTERDSICLNSLLFHEVGHFLFQRSQARNDLIVALHSLTVKVQAIASAGLLFQRPLIATAALERVLSWCQELYCDLVGATLAGPSYAIAFDRIFRLHASGANAERRFSDRYPPDLLRRSCIAKILEDQGWLKAIEETDAYKSNATFVLKARADASTGWVAAPTASPSTAAAPLIDIAIYEYRLDNMELSRVMLESFVDVVPRVFDLVRKIKFHLPDYAEGFRRKFESVTDSLLHLTVPEMWFQADGDDATIHPVTLLACGSLLLTRDLSEIHVLCGRDPKKITLDDRLWVEDRINRLVMKAVEDSLVINRWSRL